MPKSNMAVFSGPRGKRVGQTLRSAIPPAKRSEVQQLIDDTTRLRRLHAEAFGRFQSEQDKWVQRSTVLTKSLDTSGIWPQVTDVAKNDLGGFSFADNGSNIAKTLGLDRFISDWGVPDDKYAHYWPYVDHAVRKVFVEAPAGTQFSLEHAVATVFPMGDDPNFGEPWEHLGFNWKMFFSCVAMGLACMSGVGVTVAVAGIIAGSAGMGFQVP